MSQPWIGIGIGLRAGVITGVELRRGVLVGIEGGIVDDGQCRERR